jgi:hypothetical protein
VELYLHDICSSLCPVDTRILLPSWLFFYRHKDLVLLSSFRDSEDKLFFGSTRAYVDLYAILEYCLLVFCLNLFII